MLPCPKTPDLPLVIHNYWGPPEKPYFRGIEERKLEGKIYLAMFISKITLLIHLIWSLHDLSYFGFSF